MRFFQALNINATGRFLLVFVLVLTGSGVSLAQQNDKHTLKVDVSDAAGNKLQGIAVSAVPKNPLVTSAVDALGTMDQIDRQFAPHFLTVQKGTKVRFPNSDSIKHHVYSFSPAKRFELLLKRGMEEDPLLFDKNGIVELGCNVHDWMLGYIYIVDTPYFSHTNKQGQVSIVFTQGRI